MDNGSPHRARPRTATALAILGVLVLALLQRLIVAPNSDVAWLLTVAEKMLDGNVLYRDILETNPPFSVYLYTPAVIVARAFSLRPESMVDAMAILLALASLYASYRIAPKKPPPRDVHGAAIGLTALAVLTLLPGVAFGEREHIALILFMPCLALALRRAAGESARAGAVLTAGVCAGTVVCIKPHFALAVATASLAAALARRSWRPLFAPEHFIAAGIGAVYVASIFVLHPAFWSDILPLVRLLYIPVRKPLADMLDGALPVFALELAAIAAWLALRRREAIDLAFAVTGAAMLGFLLAALVQGKGWPYHFYPAFGLLALMVAGAAFRREQPGAEPVTLAISIALAAQFWLWFGAGLDMRGLDAKVRAIKERPAMISIVSDFAAGFPTVRSVGGIWVGRAFSRWVSWHAMGLAAEAGGDAGLIAAYRAAEAADRRELASDILAGRPDVILIERAPFDFLGWARRDAQIAALITCYAPRGRHVVGAPAGPGGGGLDVEVFGLRAPAPLAEGCAP